MSDLYQAVTDSISQGDILDAAPHLLLRDPLLTVTTRGDGSFIASDAVVGKTNQTVALSRVGKAIVLTHDCVLDKPHTEYWQICLLAPLSSLSKDMQGNVRKNRIYRYLHLPAFGGDIPESFVDFGVVTTVAPSFVRSANRLVSLSDFGRQAFYTQYIRWITRWELKQIDCPVCDAQFDVSLALSVRSE